MPRRGKRYRPGPHPPLLSRGSLFHSSLTVSSGRPLPPAFLCQRTRRAARPLAAAAGSPEAACTHLSGAFHAPAPLKGSHWRFAPPRIRLTKFPIGAIIAPLIPERSDLHARSLHNCPKLRSRDPKLRIGLFCGTVCFRRILQETIRTSKGGD